MTAKEFDELIEITITQLIALKGQFKYDGKAGNAEAAIRDEADNVLDITIRQFYALHDASKQMYAGFSESF